MVITTRPLIISPVGGSLEQSITAQLPVDGQMHSHTAYLAPLPSCCSLPSVHRQNVEMSGLFRIERVSLAQKAQAQEREASGLQIPVQGVSPLPFPFASQLLSLWPFLLQAPWLILWHPQGSLPFQPPQICLSLTLPPLPSLQAHLS